MAANATLIAHVTDLVALFNRKSLDLPDGLFDRQTQFLLNGTPFEAMLGRSPSDPLVLMIARGPAGYRFAIKALQHAIPDARVEIGEVEDSGQAEACVVPLWLSGQLRGTRSPVDVVVRVSVGATEAGTVTRADALIDPAMLEPIREARLRE
ncbi:MAG TPA: hypothetical protein VL263_01705 [Vicinamibacterales bacterium]|jgi:hypothetical protein|nr:hypothetical protein [Vicinamibacterales bacterium]